VSTNIQRRLERKQAAAFLTERGYRTAPATLAKLACLGGGPVFESFGRRPLYREVDLLAWAQAKTTGPRRSTSDPGTGGSRRQAALREVGALPTTDEVDPPESVAITERLDPGRVRIKEADPEISGALLGAAGGPG
jgi:hypothetical protein